MNAISQSAMGAAATLLLYPCLRARPLQCAVRLHDLGPVRLRLIVPADIPVLFEFQSDPESNALAGTKPRSREVFFAAWERNLVDPCVNSRIIEIDTGDRHETVGNIARFLADGHDCVGYWIARPYWGNGIATRALMLFLDEEHRRPLHATANRANAASHRILQKCGFRCTGYRMGEETDRFLAREIADFVLE